MARLIQGRYSCQDPRLCTRKYLVVGILIVFLYEGMWNFQDQMTYEQENVEFRQFQIVGMPGRAVSVGCIFAGHLCTTRKHHVEEGKGWNVLMTWHWILRTPNNWKLFDFETPDMIVIALSNS